ncbi:hypothetical protein GCM10010521_58450 [Streptomyces rameus]|uniref:Uncharacterized protein n=1 Tax=Streptomyces rameus TaxID=68261 RepID=A0ABP6HI43_9ACTN
MKGALGPAGGCGGVVAARAVPRAPGWDQSPSAGTADVPGRLARLTAAGASWPLAQFPAPPGGTTRRPPAQPTCRGGCGGWGCQSRIGWGDSRRAGSGPSYSRMVS